MIPSILTQEYAVPAMADGLKASKELEGYSVKYLKAELDNPGELLRLQEIETRGVQGNDVILLSRDKYSFLERYFVIVQYLEKNA
jgi:hypothetical protein